MSNMFTAAKDKAGSTTNTSKAKKDLDAVHFEDLGTLAMLKAAIEQLKTMHDTLDAEVKDEVIDEFVNRGKKLGKKPANFPGQGDHASGSMQIRQRSSRSVLTSADINTLDQLGISYKETDDTHFFINKDYADDEKLLAKVSKALESIDGIPTDFIQATPTRYVVTTQSIDELFANKRLSNDRLKEVLTIVATPAMRLKYTGDHDKLMESLSEILT